MPKIIDVSVPPPPPSRSALNPDRNLPCRQNLHRSIVCVVLFPVLLLLAPPCDAEKMEHNDHNDPLVPDIEEARDQGPGTNH